MMRVMVFAAVFLFALLIIISAVAMAFVTGQPEPEQGPELGSSGFLWPTPGSDLVTSPFGPRRSPGGIGSTNHQGIDIGVVWGSPILASAGGVVELSGWNGGFGNYIRIYHGNGHHTVYAHNSRNHVRNGDRVSQGQHIADIGSTGNSTGPHLHFEIWVNGSPVDPLPFFPQGTFRIR